MNQASTPRRRRSTRREQILSASATLFHDRGFHATGIDDIGEAVGITGPGVYRHFQSKDEILETIIRERGEASLAEVQEIVRIGGGPAAVLDRLIDHYVALLLEHPGVSHLAMYERRLLDERTRAWIERSERLVVEEWVHAVAELRPELSDAEAHFLVHTAMNMALSITGYRSGLSQQTLHALLSSMVRSALVTPTTRARRAARSRGTAR